MRKQTLAEDYEWMNSAMCAQTDPELFYPGHPNNKNNPARKICTEHCEVYAQCLARVAAGEVLEFGIRAGMGPREQDAYYKQMLAEARPDGDAA